MLRDGTVIGNKMYKNIYKQRVKLSVAAWKENSFQALMRIKKMSALRKANKMQCRDRKKMFSHWNLKGSTYALFTRHNTLRKTRKQVNV